MSLVMRLGKPLEHLQAALRATAGSGPLGEQITTIGRQLAYAGYLTYDSIIWVSYLSRSFIGCPN
jgi:peroxin-11B